MAFGGIVLSWQNRPCWVNGERAMFHTWFNCAWVAPPSMAIGGSPGGQHWELYGLVELEDGHMRKVHPSDVVFADGGEFETTAFRPRKEET